MNAASFRPFSTERPPNIWCLVHAGVTLLLLLTAAYLDIAKPFAKPWSICYLFPVLYAGWAIRGWGEVFVYAVVSFSVFLVPAHFRPEQFTHGSGLFNRILGSVIGLFIVFLIWERRRFAIMLEQANDELELRVEERTNELRNVNDSLWREIKERQKAEQEQRSMEEQLRHAQKLEAIGSLAGGIAHDFNNLLTVINGYSTLLRDELPLDSELRANAEEVLGAGERAATLTRQLLAFGRKQLLQPKLLNLNDVVMGTENLLKRLLPENIQIGVDLDSAPCLIRVDPVQLEQVLLNLSVNARDAMPNGGELHLTTESRSDHVRLTIRDTGTGIDEKLLTHIFEPFFTTKGVGKGTGLGLASTYGIIKQSGGHIEVLSKAGHGTSFVISFPCVDADTVQGDKPIAERNPVAGGAEAILLVEDEEQVRKLCATVLAAAGYHVSLAAHGVEALRLVQAGLRVDLMVTDVIMPEMSGPQLATAIREARPDLKVLFVSGYSRHEMMKTIDISSRFRFLEKPFKMDDLLAEMRTLLDSK